MDADQLYGQLAVIGERVETAGEQITTEEATKTSLVLPFFTALGYDVFNPAEVVPEFDAGLGVRWSGFSGQVPSLTSEAGYRP